MFPSKFSVINKNTVSSSPVMSQQVSNIIDKPNTVIPSSSANIFSPNPTTNLSQSTTSAVSYSRIAAESQRVSQNNAIIFDAIDNIPIAEYCYAIAKVIDSLNITHVSRISQSRICMYLKSASIATHLCETVKKVVIGDQELPIRPLLTKNKRVVISNVNPTIPDYAILHELDKLGIRPVSRLNNIKASVPGTGFAHIQSFRKQIYVPEEDIIKIPTSIPITVDQTVYHIYFSSDKLTCFLCKEEGHLAKNCQNQVNFSEKFFNDNSIVGPKEFDIDNTSTSNYLPQDTAIDFTQTSNTRFKRPLPSSNSDMSTISNSPSLSQDKKFIPINKKSKMKTSLSGSTSMMNSREYIEQDLNSVKKGIEDKSIEISVSLDQIIDFLHLSFHQHNVTPIASQLNCDSHLLASSLVIIQDFMTDNKLKNRTKKLIGKLKKQNSDSTSGDDELSLDGKL